MHTPTMPPKAASQRVKARTAGPVGRHTPGAIEPADGPFIDGRAEFDWTTVRAFAPTVPADDTPVAPGLEAPDLLSPVEGAVVDAAAVVLAWSPPEGDHHYHVQLSPDEAFRSTVLQLSTSASTELSLAGLPIPAGARLYWRVRSARPGGASEWSAAGRFYAGAPRDVDVYQARQSAEADARRREIARQLADVRAQNDLVPPYMRESSVTSPLQATLAGAVLGAACLVYVLGVLVGLLVG